MQEKYHLWGINDLTPTEYRMLKIILYERSRWHRECDEERERFRESKMPWSIKDMGNRKDIKEYL